MRFEVLATDYDGTIAHDGRVSANVIDAFLRLRRMERKLVLVTGRELDDLMRACCYLDVFDLIVAENGALLYSPRPPTEFPLALPPPASFVAKLRARGVAPLSCGRIVVATWQPHEQTVLEVIREEGLELEMIFNKGAIMILPSGINKGTGLCAALAELHVGAGSVVGVGDAENDHSLLGACAFGVAVANAVSSLKNRADLVTAAPRGEGVIELCERLLNGNLPCVEKMSPLFWG
ncbi:MAG: Cof-type HAD-IIB family hydrolase [Polyangiaceae bacterium]|nr:Cof-type HAD-IIB family hydrolase [Polyangiaceae bacterium]